MFHIHNGDVAATLVKRAGLPGEHLSFREVLVAGPVSPEPELETRARFLSEVYGHNLLRVRNDLIEQARALSAAAEHDEVVLWFEHDVFCLINLLALLRRFASHGRLSLVWSHEALATQTEADMASLFDSRASVTSSMLVAAGEAWDAYASPDPLRLNDFLWDAPGPFPFLREGLLLHASRFPSVRNGLGALENRALALIASGASDFISIFASLDENHPRFGFSDLEVMRTLRAMAWCAVPAITIAEIPESVPPKAAFGLTAHAPDVIEGRIDFLTGNHPDAWLGGAHLTRENIWRWDETARRLIRSPPQDS